MEPGNLNINWENRLKELEKYLTRNCSQHVCDGHQGSSKVWSQITLIGKDPWEHAAVEHDSKGGEDNHHENILSHQADSQQAQSRDDRGNKDRDFTSCCCADQALELEQY